MGKPKGDLDSFDFRGSLRKSMVDCDSAGLGGSLRKSTVDCDSAVLDGSLRKSKVDFDSAVLGGSLRKSESRFDSSVLGGLLTKSKREPDSSVFRGLFEKPNEFLDTCTVGGSSASESDTIFGSLCEASLAAAFGCSKEGLENAGIAMVVSGNLGHWKVGAAVVDLVACALGAKPT